MFTTIFKRFSLVLLAISALIWSPPASAQGVDPNIQVEAESFVPKTIAPVIHKETETVVVQQRVQTTRELTLDERKKLLDANAAFKAAEPAGFVALTAQDMQKYFVKYRIPRKKTVTKVVSKRVQKTKPRSIVVQFIVPANYNFESNATKSNANRVADTIAVTGGTFVLALPVGPDEDTLTFVGGTSSARYNKLSNKDVDVIVGNATFATVLGRTEHPKVKSSGTITRDKLAFGFEALSVLKPVFGAALVSFSTPSVSLSRTNIPLSDQLCGAPTKEAYCLFANVSTTLKYSWSDITTLENATARLETSVGWLTSIPGLTLTAIGGIQGSHYPHFVGGRNDFAYDLLGRVEWTKALLPTTLMTLSGAIKFTQQLSSQSILDWNGFLIAPQIKLTIRS